MASSGNAAPEGAQTPAQALTPARKRPGSRARPPRFLCLTLRAPAGLPRAQHAAGHGLEHGLRLHHHSEWKRMVPHLKHQARRGLGTAPTSPHLAHHWRRLLSLSSWCAPCINGTLARCLINHAGHHQAAASAAGARHAGAAVRARAHDQGHGGAPHGAGLRAGDAVLLLILRAPALSPCVPPRAGDAGLLLRGGEHAWSNALRSYAGCGLVASAWPAL